jgi:hypothetical protein
MIYTTLRKVSVLQLEATWLGVNKTYQFVYSSILNTTFATAMPVVLLFYLNMSTVVGNFLKREWQLLKTLVVPHWQTLERSFKK